MQFELKKCIPWKLRQNKNKFKSHTQYEICILNKFVFLKIAGLRLAVFEKCFGSLTFSRTLGSVFI